MLRPFLPAFLLTILLFFAGGATPVHAAWWWPFGYKGLDYTITFSGIDQPTQNWLKELKLDERNTANPPQNRQDLTSEASSLGNRLRMALEAKGYYDATFTTAITAPPEGKATLAYTITPGPRYTLGRISTEWHDAPLSYTSPTQPFQSGDPVDAQAILAHVPVLEEALTASNCLLSLEITPRLTLHQNNHTAHLAYLIRHGAVANFGPTQVSGTEHVDPIVVTRALTWQQGVCYRTKTVEESRAAVLETRLFSNITIRHAPKPNAAGEVPMHVTVKERAPRTLSFGASYGTDDTGLAVTAGWEHRNIFGAGQTFTTNALVSQNKQTLDNTLIFPHILPKTRLVLTGNLTQEDTDAYTTTGLETGASLQRPLAKNLIGGVGVGFDILHTEDPLTGNSDYALLSFPTFLTFDNRDDVLNSRKGLYANLSATPYTETLGDGGQFLKTQLTAQTYLSANWPLSPTLALRGSIGSISGAGNRKIPSTIRFYTGGGNSVRGYGYQTLGPRSNNTAIGGASLFNASTEVRTWFTPTLGGVAFVDAGNVYRESTPQLDKKLYYGSGVGLRYATPIGPLRLDVAVPLNGNDIGADGYALYLSIGQAF